MRKTCFALGVLVVLDLQACSSSESVSANTDAGSVEGGAVDGGTPVMTSEEIVDSLFKTPAPNFDPVSVEGLYRVDSAVVPFDPAQSSAFPMNSELRLRVSKDVFLIAFKSAGGARLGVRIPILPPVYDPSPDVGAAQNPGGWNLKPTASVKAQTATPCVDKMFEFSHLGDDYPFFMDWGNASSHSAERGLFGFSKVAGKYGDCASPKPLSRVEYLVLTKIGL